MERFEGACTDWTRKAENYRPNWSKQIWTGNFWLPFQLRCDHCQSRKGYNCAAQMTITSGTKLGPYEVVAPAGAGGMGEVYRARDARLNRDVAVKILPAAFARDPERMRRFQQEAQAVA